MTRCTYCRVSVYFHPRDDLVNAEHCLGNCFEVPKPRVQSIFEWGYLGLFWALFYVGLASNDLFYFKGVLMMLTFVPSMGAAGMIGPCDSRGYLRILSYGAVAWCYAYAVMLRKPSLPGFERFFAYYLSSAYLACMFPLLCVFFHMFNEN